MLDPAEPSTSGSAETDNRPAFLFVCSTGRAGSTMIMRALARHERVLTREVFPFETRFRQYVEAARHNGRETLSFQPEQWNSTPYVPFQGDDALGQRWAAAAPRPATESSAFDFYAEVARRQNRQTTPHWIAEKGIGVNLVVRILESDPRARALFMFRDPRDTYYSMKAFNRKAGYPGGFLESHGDEAMFRNIIGTWRRFKRLKKQMPWRVMRGVYERLAAGRGAAYRRILAKLELDTSDEQLTAMLAPDNWDTSSDRHSTSGSARGSIGRWREEATDSDRLIFAAYASDLEDMGYAP